MYIVHKRNMYRNYGNETMVRRGDEWIELMNRETRKMAIFANQFHVIERDVQGVRYYIVCMSSVHIHDLVFI